MTNVPPTSLAYVVATPPAWNPCHLVLSLPTQITQAIRAEEAEKKVDDIIYKLKDGQIDLTTAVEKTMNVENVNMLGIDENNVEEALTQ